MLPGAGCRGRNLIGSRDTDGGFPDLSGADRVISEDGASPTDMSSPDLIAPVDAAVETAGGDASVADAGTDGARDAVDPLVSRAWTWQRCGTIAAEGPDKAAVFDPTGGIAVLGERGVRRYDPSGRLQSTSNGAADLLLAAPGGLPLTGSITSSAIVMTPIGATAPRFTFALPAGSTCGRLLAFSASGDYLLAYGAGAACVWRTSDQALVSNVANIDSDQVALRGDQLVSVEDNGQMTDAVTRDFTGRETARVTLAHVAPAFLSPSGDRLVMAGMLWDLDSGMTIPLTPAFLASSAPPSFSAAGDLVLVGGAVFRTSDGVRQQTSNAGSRVEQISTQAVLSADGRRVISMQHGRATLFDIASDGITAVLGPPPLPGSSTSPASPINSLALSADGSLLVSNFQTFAAFGIAIAPTFDASRVIWDIGLEVNLVVDISSDNQLVAIAGDGRALFSAVDGRNVWLPPPPPAAIPTDICFESLRFSPKRTWVAGANYERTVDVFAVGDATTTSPWTAVAGLPAGCNSVAFSRDERLMATSGGTLYQTAATAAGWQKLWSASVPAAPAGDTASAPGGANDVSFSPDERQLLLSQCNSYLACTTSLVSVESATLLRILPDLQQPHPSFSPDGSWIVAGGTLLHLVSGDVRSLDPEVKTTAALFTPEGDIIAGSADHALRRYCRNQ
jgi:WD40 repeat protein